MTRSADDLVTDLSDTVDYLRVHVRGDDRADERDWVGCEPLVSDPDALLALVTSTMAGRGTDRVDVAMSLFVQGYSFRLASVAIGSWVLGDEVLDVSPGDTSIALGRHRPNAVLLGRATLVDGGDRLHGLHRHLIDDHLARLVDSAHRACRIGEPLLWGNVGAACASSFGAFMGPLADRRSEIRDRAEAFYAAARPELAGSGRIARVGPVWAWERSACCLWYKTESGFRCEDCSLWTDEERRERYDRVLSGSDL